MAMHLPNMIKIITNIKRVPLFLNAVYMHWCEGKLINELIIDEVIYKLTPVSEINTTLLTCHPHLASV